MRDSAAEHNGDIDHDIFRGEPPPPVSVPPPRPSSPGSLSSSSSSSSSSSYFGGRLGPIAALVELAISRWARNESSSSSSSSSDSESIAHSRITRRSKSEHHISTRIDLLQAREESRQIPRQFALYLPPSLSSPDAGGERVVKTKDLSSILGKLDAALKKSTRVRRRERAPHPEEPPRLQHLHFMLPDVVKAPSRAASFTDLNGLGDAQRKGKQREGQQPKHSPSASKAWFLDIASPTWDDMRAIGKLLHLHPLTLEDILMKDPREKLEHFPKLGYYFLSFRAIEAWDTREKYQDDGGDHGSVAESNVYLVVFKEGVCSFHFTDVSDHIDRVRNRILLLEKVMNMSSDWIAHGILDSIVDSFFPFLQGLEKEVVAIENIVFSSTSVLPHASSGQPAEPRTVKDVEKVDLDIWPDESKGNDVEKVDFDIWPDELTEKAVARLNRRKIVSLSSMLSKWKDDAMARWWSSGAKKSSPSSTALTLRRMARVRRLVTSLSRLLASKGEVVAQLRKRLMTSGSGSNSEDVEVAIYLGDVQDHILSLETALGHYERMLSQSHPLYISQIRTTVGLTKGNIDKVVLFLSCVSIAVLCCQTPIGLFSLNVRLPHNSLDGSRYNVFAAILALDILILFSFVKLVHHWWKTSKRKTLAGSL